MTKVTVSKNNIQSSYQLDALAAICLKICGGGYTVNQTAQAMELQTKIRTTGNARKNGYTIILE